MSVPFIRVVVVVDFRNLNQGILRSGYNKTIDRHFLINTKIIMLGEGNVCGNWTSEPRLVLTAIVAD